jgi:hypothetical protein
LRRIIAVALLFFAPLLASGAPSIPVVQGGTINYLTNQITLTGSGFEPSKITPTVLFKGSSLALSSFTNFRIVAKLPSGLLPGTFNLTVTNSLGRQCVFSLSYDPSAIKHPRAIERTTAKDCPIPTTLILAGALTSHGRYENRGCSPVRGSQ